jgi:hypothetical protein
VAALFVDDKDIREKPLLERKETLKAILPRDPLVRYSGHVVEFGKREFAKARQAHETIKRRSRSPANTHEKSFEEIFSRSPTLSEKIGGGGRN